MSNSFIPSPACRSSTRGLCRIRSMQKLSRRSTRVPQLKTKQSTVSSVLSVWSLIHSMCLKQQACLKWCLTIKLCIDLQQLMWMCLECCSCYRWPDDCEATQWALQEDQVQHVGTSTERITCRRVHLPAQQRWQWGTCEWQRFLNRGCSGIDDGSCCSKC